MSNEQMIAGRFARWSLARKKLAWIHARIAEGRTVYVCTMTRATSISPAFLAKHPETFKATKSGLYQRNGQSWVCIDFSGLRAS